MTVTDDIAATATAHLRHLGDLLEQQGLRARVRTAHRQPPHLAVVNPEAPVLSEDIYAAPHEGSWWYRWSWAERIASVDDASAAARRIHHVLTPQGRGES